MDDDADEGWGTLSPMDRARKRYDVEDPAGPAWALHRKHIFILSSAGKPIFSRYGDESKLAPLVGVLQALISFVSDGGDTIRHIAYGRHRAVFVLRGPLYLVAVSSCGDTVDYLARQLDYLHGQIISMLTAKVEGVFVKNASYDLRTLLGGADRVLRNLIRSFAAEPSVLMQAVPCLRFPPSARAELGKLLAAARPAELLFGLLFARGFLVQMLRPKRTQLAPSDVLLVMNTVSSSAAFREDESWLPLCLPRYNRGGFLYAHVSFVAPELCLVFITAGRDAFGALSAARAQVVSGLQQREELRGALFRALAEPQATVDEHAPPEVAHYIYRLNGLGQYTLPRLGRHAGEQCAYQDRQAVKRLLRRYQLAQSRVHAGEKPLREYYQATDAELIVAWTAAEYELYVALGPRVSRPAALAACAKLRSFLKKEERTLFLTSPPTITGNKLQ